MSENIYRRLPREEFEDVASRIVYEDNHLLVFNKRAGEIVQADKTEDETLADLYKSYIAMRDGKPGSVFILCSDGLSGMIHNNAILTTVTRYDLPLKERADMLVRQANEAGGLDNVTVQLVEFPGNTVAAQAAAASAAYAKSRKKKGNALVYTIVALLVVAVAGGLTFWFVGGDKEEAKPKVKPTVVTKPKQSATKEKAAQPTTTTTTETTTVIVKEEETPKATTKRVDKTKAITRKAKQVKEKTDATKDETVRKALEEKQEGKRKPNVKKQDFSSEKNPD